MNTDALWAAFLEEVKLETKLDESVKIGQMNLLGSAKFHKKCFDRAVEKLKDAGQRP